ncbi:MAG TPA: hypothetical protein PLR41_01000 [Alphaproteobacteria bacterium]|nr:hypothetical protein [Alphaproteobacteria bacterium]
MIDKSLLRELVKAVIAEEVAAIRKSAAAPAQPASAKPAPAPESVRIASDADLVAFARKVLSLAGDPAKAKDIAAGRYPFRLEQPVAAAPATAPRAPVGTAPAAAPKPTASGQTLRIDSGVVTETMLNKLPRGLAKLVLAPGVTVTPLAKDRARTLGLTFERTSS